MDDAVKNLGRLALSGLTATALATLLSDLLITVIRALGNPSIGSHGIFIFFFGLFIFGFFDAVATFKVLIAWLILRIFVAPYEKFILPVLALLSAYHTYLNGKLFTIGSGLSNGEAVICSMIFGASWMALLFRSSLHRDNGSGCFNQ